MGVVLYIYKSQMQNHEEQYRSGLQLDLLMQCGKGQILTLLAYLLFSLPTTIDVTQPVSIIFLSVMPFFCISEKINMILSHNVEE